MQLLRWLSWTGYQYDTGAFSHAGQHNLRLQFQEVFANSLVGSHNTQPKNFAAVIPSSQAQLEVAEVPYPKFGNNELVIKNFAAAINPVDWKIQTTGGIGFNLSYPLLLGEDVAGEVLEVGPELKGRFQVGDRVIAHPLGLEKGAAYGGFQLYPVLTAATVSKIPNELSFEEAAVLPLSISTAAAGLFMNATLGLEYPPIDSESLAYYEDGSTLLVWGCSSSIGSSVIQLAKAAGYDVVTTASPIHHKYCKDLGASQVLDYHDKHVVNQLIALLKGKTLVGAYDAIGSDLTVRQSAAILHALGGGKIASVGLAPDVFSDVVVTRISSGNIVSDEPEVADEIWGRYVPWALKSGKLIPSPKALVVGKGLGDVQKGLDRQKEGVSARKVVVLLG